MSGLAVQSDNSLFTADAEVTTTVTAPQTDAPTGTPSAAEAPLGDVAEVVALEDDGIGADIDALQTPDATEPPTDETPAETPEPVDEAGMQAFSAQFEKFTGVPLKEAMATYKETAQAAQAAQTELNALYEKVSIQQQRLDLQSTWVNDPEIQQQIQSGTPLSAAVEQRLDTLRGVYEKLGETRQKRIDSLGTQGILELWKIVNKKSGTRSLPGVSSVPASGATDSSLKKLSEIMTMPEAEFRSTGAKLLQDKQFINDIQL